MSDIVDRYEKSVMQARKIYESVGKFFSEAEKHYCDSISRYLEHIPDEKLYEF